MDHHDFPWRLLGTLLVERGLLTAGQLEHALAEQRRTGRLLGQILVTRGHVSALSLARVLAEQHGVELKSAAGPAPSSPQPQSSRSRGELVWRPLGRLLVEQGLVSQEDLGRALTEQAQHPERRLGELLVARGHLSGVALAAALAEQHGVALAPEDELEGRLEAVLAPASPGQPRYRVHEATFEPAYRHGRTLYESTNFLEATDFAFEYVESEQPVALEIQKGTDGAFETVWTYSERRAAAASQSSLVSRFGFDPARWDTRGRFEAGGKQP